MNREFKDSGGFVFHIGGDGQLWRMIPGHGQQVFARSDQSHEWIEDNCHGEQKQLALRACVPRTFQRRSMDDIAARVT